ncbi:hypothetical protein BDN67DRAFT_976767 [Paxillus ammoniavirescens]|nr:hypothetical protein BDN67DRAFT_976767 [Paxillus ammoniavirescens]
MMLEAQAFATMLQARTIILTDDNSAPSTALFKLYKDFALDGSTPDSRIVNHDGDDCLRINYLEQDG